MAPSTLLIVGASGGIGSALARRLVQGGHRVALMGRRPEALAALVAELGPQALAVAGDARDSAEMERAVATCQAHFGGLDGLAHAVGSIVIKPLHLSRLEELEAALTLNLSTLFVACKAVLPGFMAQRGGAILAFSSAAALTGLANHEVISAAKAGVAGLIRSLAITYAGFGIRANAIAPGLTETPLSAFLTRSPQARALSEAMHPLGRLGRPDEIAALGALLLGPEGGWITGQVIAVDGGLSAGCPPRRG